MMVPELSLTRLRIDTLVQLLLNLAHVEHCPVSSNVLDIRDRRVLLAFEDGVDFFQRLAFGLDPKYCLGICW